MGTPGRSKAFQDAYYGAMGRDNTIPDQIAGMKELAQRYPWIDIDRAGIWGHSGGGFATTPRCSGFPISSRSAHGQPVVADAFRGGPSGGSAAAIAAGMVPMATGSDGGGSIRIPSALCGLTGMKASFGRVAVGGDAPGWVDLSARGPMARRLADIAYALEVVAGPHPTDPLVAVGAGPLRARRASAVARARRLVTHARLRAG